MTFLPMTEQTPSLATIITRLAEPLATSMGLLLWGVEMLPGGKSVVRVFVESVEAGQGVDIEQCAALSRLLGLSLEVEDCIPGAYVLEVSSPGLERRYFTAGQLAGAVGEYVEITLFAPLPNFPLRRKFQGELRAASSGGLFSLAAADIAPPGEAPPLVSFSFEEIRKAKRIHFVPEKVLPGKKGKPGGKTKIEPDKAPVAE